MALLQTVTKHGAVVLVQEVFADLDHEVGAHPKNVGVKCSVVDLAHRHTVLDCRHSMFLAIADDVRSIEKLAVAKGADRAASSIRPHDISAKHWLMKALSGLHLDVPTEAFLYYRFREHQILQILETSDELVVFGVLAHKMDWENR